MRFTGFTAVKLARRVLPPRTAQCAPSSDTVTLPSLLTGNAVYRDFGSNQTISLRLLA